MSISMRKLFERKGIPNEVISLRHSLANHPDGLKLGLREAETRFTAPADGDGFARGCRRPGTTIQDILGLTEIKFPEDFDPLLELPGWVPVAGSTALIHHRLEDGTVVTFLREDFTGETRTVEGVLTKSAITHKDFPFKPWHTYYDWNFFVQTDRQYTYLLSPAVQSHRDGSLECEWDTGVLPKEPETNIFWMLPQVGDRVWMVGRWIYDCGHPTQNGHRTEIHPPKAIASFRTEAVAFPGNHGPTQANNAFLYIGREGGYWNQPINNQDYAFDLYLPPQPHPAALPLSRVIAKTGALPIQPHITPYPASAPKVLRVVIPLSQVEQPILREYGAIISGGWSDPDGTETAKIRRVRVTVEKIFLDKDSDSTSKGEWHPYIGINGRWKVPNESLSKDTTLNFSVELDLHPEDVVHITACGFETDGVHSIIGRSIGLSWIEVSDQTKTQHNLNRIIVGFSKEVLDVGTVEAHILDPTLFDFNEPIGLLSEQHRVNDLPLDGIKSRIAPSDKKDYRLQYSVTLI